MNNLIFANPNVLVFSHDHMNTIMHMFDDIGLINFYHLD